MTLEKLLKFVFGLILIVAAVLLVVIWWGHFVTLVLGGIPVLLALAGAVMILLGLEK
jgi:hypothetical protein